MFPLKYKRSAIRIRSGVDDHAKREGRRVVSSSERVFVLRPFALRALLHEATRRPQLPQRRGLRDKVSARSPVGPPRCARPQRKPSTVLPRGVAVRKQARAIIRECLQPCAGDVTPRDWASGARHSRAQRQFSINRRLQPFQTATPMTSLHFNGVAVR